MDNTIVNHKIKEKSAHKILIPGFQGILQNPDLLWDPHSQIAKEEKVGPPNRPGFRKMNSKTPKFGFSGPIFPCFKICLRFVLCL